MSPPRPEAEVLAERLAVVLEIGEANAARQRAQAGAGGAQIELMTVEDRVGGAASADALTLARAREADAQARVADAAARIDALDARLAALDLELAAARG